MLLFKYDFSKLHDSQRRFKGGSTVGIRGVKRRLQNCLNRTVINVRSVFRNGGEKVINNSVIVQKPGSTERQTDPPSVVRPDRVVSCPVPQSTPTFTARHYDTQQHISIYMMSSTAVQGSKNKARGV